MILLLVWAAGLFAIGYEAWKHGAFPMIAALSWVWALFLWAVCGAWAVARSLRRPRIPNPTRERWQRAVEELARRDAEKQRAEGSKP